MPYTTPAASAKQQTLPSPNRWQKLRSWGPWQLFWLALGIRITFMTLLRYYHVRPQQDHFEFGWEMGRIGRALASGRGYADPFIGHTGPTAWVTPLYPLLVATVFKLFGIYSASSAWVILAVDSVLNALMIPLIWSIAERVFSSRTARASAWVWALYPAAMQYAVKWFWEMTLTALLFQAALLLALKMRGIGDPGNVGEPEKARADSNPTWPRWLLFGVIWGAIALSNPGVLLFLPVSGVWILAAKGRDWWRDLPKAFASALLFMMIVAPWSYRNWTAFHAFVPLRSNFGAELYMGNGPGAAGFIMEFEHPNVSIKQYGLYSRMGELSYTQYRGQLAKAIIRRNPLRFVRLCLTRIYFFWSGIPNPSGKPFSDAFRGINYCGTSCLALLGLMLLLKRRLPASGLIAAAFLAVPLVYYFISAHARFRHPLEPLMAMLCVYVLQQSDKRWGFSIFNPAFQISSLTS